MAKQCEKLGKKEMNELAKEEEEEETIWEPAKTLEYRKITPFSCGIQSVAYKTSGNLCAFIWDEIN